MSTEVIKVSINGKEFEVPKGARLIDVCREKAFDIPSFCYYSDLALQASCRMCLVRIEKMPKLQTSCTIICTDGMIVTTQSDEIEKAQRSMLEFLLANHPLDCPVCDRGGECELQEMTFDWGGLEERFTEKKNYHPETISCRRSSPTIRSAAFSANVARVSVTNGWVKTRSKLAVAARTRSSELMEAGSIVRNAATALKFARPERCWTALIVTRPGRGNWRKQFPPAAFAQTAARCRLVRAAVKSCAWSRAIVTSTESTASFSASRAASVIRSSTTKIAFARR